MHLTSSALRLDLDIQVAVDTPAPPSQIQLRRWVKAALVDRCGATEMTIRIVDEAEISSLNQTYRHRTGPTNILSFPFQTPFPELPIPLLGDVVICAPLVVREAQEQQKATAAHWAHLVVHGVLHLQGYDHQEEDQAVAMEHLEIKILAKLGYLNPYRDVAETILMS